MSQKILIIEDNQDNYQLVRFLLERVGFQVEAAFDGISGLQAVTDHMPALILLDLAIPEMDGWEAAKRIKENPKTKHIPLVALTARTLPVDRRRAMESGCDGYIAKPIDVETFLDEVTAYLPKE